MSHPNELRPVEFARAGKMQRHGQFHCWGSDATAYEGVPMTVGIVEAYDGRVHMIEADKIRFVDVPSSSAKVIQDVDQARIEVIKKAAKLVHTHDQIEPGEWEELEDELNDVMDMR